MNANENFIATVSAASSGAVADATTTSAADVRRIFRFWFGDDVFSTFPLHKTRYWFDNWRQALDKNEQVAHIARVERDFKALIDLAADSGLQGWSQGAHSGLALILLLDRLAPRVLANRTALRECNRLAIECCCLGLREGLLEEFTGVETCFYLAPLTVARREAQRRLGLRLLEEQLAEVSDPESGGHAHRSLVQQHLFYAVKNEQLRSGAQRRGEYKVPQAAVMLSA